MTSSVRRSVAFAAVGSLVLGAPLLGWATALPFVILAAVAATRREGTLFELFARPADRRAGRLAGLVGFTLAGTALSLLATVPEVRMPLTALVASVLVVAYGDLGRALVQHTHRNPFVDAAGFVVVGFLAAVGGQLLVAWLSGALIRLPTFIFLASTGALTAALLRAVLRGHDDPLVMLSVGLLLWLLATVEYATDPLWITLALLVTLALGYVSYAIGTASVPGMLAGMIASLLALVLGGGGWFAVLVSFFAVGGLSTKFRYERKRARGIAEGNEGARGSGNVLANSGVALLALVAFAASDHLTVPPDAIQLAFAGSVAAAMSDTLSSEIGGLFDDPRLLTTFERVEPGTDGAVTWQGELAGLSGAVLVAGISYGLLGLPIGGAIAVVLGGVVGMTIDSLLGATLEGGRLGNQSVNFLATLSGALTSGGLWFLL